MALPHLGLAQVLCRSGDRLLLIRHHAGKPNAGQWNGPGGLLRDQSNFLRFADWLLAHPDGLLS